MCLLYGSPIGSWWWVFPLIGLTLCVAMVILGSRFFARGACCPGGRRDRHEEIR